MIDLLLVNPGARARTYGELAELLSGIEPPFWAGLVASYVREHGYSVAILDADAEGWAPDYTADRIAELEPRLVAMIVQGANPSASSTPKMTAAGRLLRELQGKAPNVKTLLAGIHPSALPARTLREEAADYVCKGEPFEAILRLLRGDKTPPGLVLSRLLEPDEFPPVAWDLLDMTKYRAHNWHCLDDLEKRSPYAILYTSLGCPYSCTFCDIKAFFGSDRRVRYRSIEDILAELDLVVINHGVRKIKIMDEMFALSEGRVVTLCDKIIDRGYNLDMWAYARVDTVTPIMLTQMKKAGINWVGYGLECGSDSVRQGIGKRFTNETIDKAIKMTRDAGIYIMPAIIFGLPDDNMETMRQTLEMAEHYNFEYINMYCATAYPGSELWEDAVKNGLRLPDTWEGYSQLAYDFIPLPTKYLSPKEVLRFRDWAFEHYFSRPEYLSMIGQKFSSGAVEHIKDMLEYKIMRREYDTRYLYPPRPISLRGGSGRDC